MTGQAQELAARPSVPELARVWQECETDIRQAFILLRGAEKKLTEAFGRNNCGVRVSQRGRSLNWDCVQDALDEAKQDVWQVLVERLEVRRFMSVRAWKEQERAMERGEMPDITEENLSSMFASFANQMPQMIEESVREVFDWLRPWRKKYKSNDPWQIGKKVVLEFCVEKSGYVHPWRVRCETEQRLTALENVFTSLDGRGQVTKTHFSELSNAIKEAEDGAGETRYFKFQVFKNGNLHLTFKRPDLVQRINEIAGGKSLKPCENGGGDV